MSDEDIFKLGYRLRFGDGGQQTCPNRECGAIDSHYFIATRKQWRCKHCGHTFSLTSSTKWAYHKLPLRTLMKMCAELALAAQGCNATTLANRLLVECKTVWVNLQKLREAVFDTREQERLVGTIHVDAAYVCYHVRPKNAKQHRVDRRLRRNQNPHKRAIIVWRQLADSEEVRLGFVGATKTRFSVIREENQADVLKLTLKNIEPGSTICCDQNDAYLLLKNLYKVRTVNHEVEYVAPDGTTNNQAESTFARLRRMQREVHHFWWKHAWLHAAHLSYLEDVRRTDTKVIFNDLVSRCLRSAPSRHFSGYFQGNKCHEELMCF